MSHSTRRSKTPLGVKTLAFLVALDGVIALLNGLGILPAALPLGLLLLAIGGLHVLLAYGLWQLEPLAYTVGMALFAVGALADLASLNVFAAGLSVLNMVVLYHFREQFDG